MVKVAPSMLSCDFSRFGEELSRIEDSGADWAHLDVMDGMFVPNLTFGAPVIRKTRSCTDLPFDVHLMIEDPVRYIGDFADAGADIITVHAEADGDIAAAVAAVKDRGIRVGVAIDPETPVSALEPYLDDVDMILIMTVKAGFGGQKFHPECVEKIAEVDDIRKERGSDFLIEVDGGIDRDTGKTCVDAGADVLVAGSSLFRLEDMGPEISVWHTYRRE